MADQLAIQGGAPVRTKPFAGWPVFGESDQQALIAALQSGNWGKLQGDQVRTFEKRFAEYHEARHGVAIVNGTVGLRLALLAAGIQAGDEVLVPPYTFLATASAVIEANAVPVFVDLELDTFNIDPKGIEAAITPRTRAVIPVHLGGLPCNMEAIMAIARRHKLTVIEDACHAHGAAYQGHRVGSLGDLGVFSFQSSKNLCSGEGGIILTNDDELAARCWSMHNCGRVPGGAWYEHHVIGGNYRLSEFQGAVLNSQFDRFDQQADTRDRNGKYLAGRLAKLPGIYPQVRTADCTRHGYHLFSLRVVADEFGMPREVLLDALKAEGIPTSPGYLIPLYRQRLFENLAFGPYTSYRASQPNLDYRKVTCPNCETISYSQGVWLEQRIFLGTREDMDDIAAAFEKVHAHRDQLAPAAG
ncbi:MAG: DegT/DnrJ/EryC1/StrS family aminotransferase [Pirellulales bacterium]|nr:DegT/DnrJ/EryC1/StrS family aminotransferase [Pirellulales bacterium]